MRTTLTLDDDVAALVKAEVRRSGDGLKETVNRLLRQGFTAAQHDRSEAPFRVEPVLISRRPGMNYDKISELIEELEGPYHR